MGTLKDAWQALVTVATVAERVKKQQDVIERLAEKLNEQGERLARIEGMVDLARQYNPPKLPGTRERDRA